MFCLNFGLIREAGRMAQSVCCCLCIMMCGGPILLIAGIIILALPNTRKEDVEKYNTDGAKYNAAPVDKWSGTIAEAKAYTTSEAVVVESGSSEDVDSFTSVSKRASVNVGFSPPSQVVRYRLSTVADADPYVSSSVFKSQKTGSVTCQSSGGCSISQMTSLCRSKYDSNAYGTAFCRKDEICSCIYYVYLNTYCLVATASSGNANTFVMSTTYKSCFYPFTSTDAQKFSIYQSTTATVSFQLRLDTDPFVIMQEITKGDMDFGITIEQQRKIAVALIAIGCVMIGCIVIIVFLLYKVIKAFTDKNGGATQPLNNYNQQQQYGQQQQQQYGQQQQQYSQPQTPQNFPPYQQQQTNYAQPQLRV